jgi:ribose transport system permease protein
MLNLAIPIVLATIAQLFVISGNELDLSIGSFVGFVGCVTATWLNDAPGSASPRCSARCRLCGHRRVDLPAQPASIVVTLGMSFVWQGLAILMLPSLAARRPSGCKHPGLQAAVRAVADRGCGGDRRDRPSRPDADVVRRDPARLRRQSRGTGARRLVAAQDQVVLFALAGFFGVLSGMALISITTSADANIGSGYTLLAIAGVILGGGEFVGGRVSPVGAVVGALTMALAASPLLTFTNIPPDWQVAANGAILIVVLAARALVSRRED